MPPLDKVENEDQSRAYQEFALVYDEMMRELDYPAWVEYVLGLYRRHRSSPAQDAERVLLDLACGTGTFMALMMEKGWRVTGVDRSPSMLAVAEAKLGKRKGGYRLFAQDLRELDLDEQFPFITCLCDSLNYLLDAEDLQRVFGRIYRHLLPGGVLIADFNTAYKYREVLAENSFCAVYENSAYIWCNSLEPAARLCRMEIDFFRREKGELFRHFHEVHCQRWYEPAEIKDLARKAGFAQVSFYSAFTGEPCRPEDERIFAVFTRE